MGCACIYSYNWTIALQRIHVVDDVDRVTIDLIVLLPASVLFILTVKLGIGLF